MARPFVADIREHDRVVGFFLATKKSLFTTKSGSPYLSVTLSDRTGDIEGRVWEDAERIDQAFEKGSYVKVDGVASSYNGRMQLKVERVRAASKDEVDPRDFVPTTRFDVDLMWGEVTALVAGVGDEQIRRLLQAFLDDPELAPLVRRAPAAKNVHHAFLGGLLEHTLSVMQLAHRIADHYPRANRDLLVAGAFLHDLGKVRELAYETAIDYTTEGRLVGHLVLVMQWIHDKVSALPGFPRELEMHLVHLVAAHHGELEFGSPKVPHTLEAMIVHALDELDSRVQSWSMLMDRDRNAEWTDFQRLYDRPLYKRRGWGREEAGLGPVPEGTPWQGSSLYRREALGLVGTPPAPPVAEEPAQKGGTNDKRGAKREPPAKDAPVVPDLFARPKT